jgi:hypothetical protein
LTALLIAFLGCQFILLLPHPGIVHGFLDQWLLFAQDHHSLQNLDGLVPANVVLLVSSRPALQDHINFCAVVLFKAG